MKELVRVDRRWIPEEENCSLYIRPTYIGTQVSISSASSVSVWVGCPLPFMVLIYCTDGVYVQVPVSPPLYCIVN